jgi:hypothetical protein
MSLVKNLIRFSAGVAGVSIFAARYAASRLQAESMRGILSDMYEARGITVWRGPTNFYEDGFEILFAVPPGTSETEYLLPPDAVCRSCELVAAMPSIHTVGLSTCRTVSLAGWRLFTEAPIVEDPAEPEVIAPLWAPAEAEASTNVVSPFDRATGERFTDFQVDIGSRLDDGETHYLDFTKFSGMLLSGVSGYGKSNFLHILMLQFANKENVELAIIDPKRVEFMSYAGLGNLYRPIAKDFGTAMQMLRAIFREMEERYCMLEREHMRKLPLDRKTIILVVDEFQDFSVEAKKDPAAFNEMQDLLLRIISKGRAAGIKTILSAPYMLNALFKDGLIKGNLGVRVVFRLPNKNSSITIAGMEGAETLSHGQALVVNDDGSNAKVQTHLIEDAMIKQVVLGSGSVDPRPDDAELDAAGEDNISHWAA